MSALTTEFTTDPTGLGYAQALAVGDDSIIYELLHAKNISIEGSISPNLFMVWAAKTGQASVIVDIADDKTNSTGLRAIAIVLKNCLGGDKTSSGLEMGNAEVVAMMDIWFLTQGNSTIKAALIALSQTLISRADQLGIDCSITAIRSCIWADNGTRIM